jgi:formylglycine-generating enzyme required for sulfatase activity
MSKVFISYRRDDSADVAGRIYDRLLQAYGPDDVVMDVESIPPGADFREFLSEAVGRCRVLLAVIGPQWLPIVNRRRDDPLDFVRLEIEAALQRRIPVIPVLVSGAVMPGHDQLPPPLQPLAFRNASPVRSNPDFHRDMDRLLKSLDRWLQEQTLPPAESRPAAGGETAKVARPAPTSAVPSPAAPELTNPLGMKLILVPRGSFWMGDRGRQKQVEVPRDFYLGVFPVTQEQWQAVMGSNPSWFSRNGKGADKVESISDADLGQFPVERVSWDDVQEFLKRLNARERDSGFLYRLPAEAEWEYSCRERAFSQEECAFDFYLSQPTNDLSSEQANFGFNLGRTSKVGSYAPNRLGLYDMHGNVWEWCADPWEAGGSARVIRGGGWSGDAADCRASVRGCVEPAYRYGHLGFRLVAVPSGE